MFLSYFLAAFLGWYCVIMSLLLFFRRDLLLKLMQDVMTQPTLLFIIGILTLIVGLFLVVSHNIWVWAWPVLITLLAWMVLISGIIRLFFPEWVYQVWPKLMSSPNKLYRASVLTLLIGLFLLFKAYF